MGLSIKRQPVAAHRFSILSTLVREALRDISSRAHTNLAQACARLNSKKKKTRRIKPRQHNIKTMSSLSSRFAVFTIAISLIAIIHLGERSSVSARSVSIANNEETRHMHPTALHARTDVHEHSRAKRGNMPPIMFSAPDLERNGDYWLNIGQQTLEKQLHKNQLNRNVARNVIMFLGDGMSIPTLAATRIYMGGEAQQLPFERFPYAGLSKTYCANTQVADSACTATAYLGGVKGNYATIGLTAAVGLNDCRGENNTAHHVPSIAKWAQDRGLSTGLVTTTSVTHASPAGVYAHTSNRNFENNQALINEGGDPTLCKDIARQLIEDDVGRNLRVVMGGGRREFMRTDQRDADNKAGLRTDGVDLIKRWRERHAQRNEKAVYAQTKAELANVSDLLACVI